MERKIYYEFVKYEIAINVLQFKLLRRQFLADIDPERGPTQIHEFSLIHSSSFGFNMCSKLNIKSLIPLTNFQAFDKLTTLTQGSLNMIEIIEVQYQSFSHFIITF